LSYTPMVFGQPHRYPNATEQMSFSQRIPSNNLKRSIRTTTHRGFMTNKT